MPESILPDELATQGILPPNFPAPTGGILPASPAMSPISVGAAGQSLQESILAYNDSAVGKYMHMRQMAMLARSGLPMDTDPNEWTMDEAESQSQAALAKIATINPEMAEEIEAKRTGKPPEQGFFEDLKDLAGDIIQPALSLGGKALEILTRTARIVPELITDKEDEPWYEDIGQALTGHSTATGADVLKRYGIKNKTAQAIGGFAFEVIADPLTWATFGGGGIAKTTAAKTAGVAAGASRLLPEVSTLAKTSQFLKPGEDLLSGTMRVMTHLLSTKSGFSDDVARGFGAMGTNLVSQTAQREALELASIYSATRMRMPIQKLGNQIPLSTGKTVARDEVEGILKELVKRGNFASRRSAEAMTARQAAGALGGVRARVGIPFTSFRYISPAIPYSWNLNFMAASRFFTGESGSVRMNKLITDDQTMEKISAKYGVDRMATWDDYETWVRGGFSALKEGTPKQQLLANYLGSGGLHLGSMMMPLSQQIGKVTSHLLPHAAAIRAGNIGASMAADLEKTARSNRDEFIRVFGLNLYREGTDELETSSKDMLELIKRNLSADPTKQDAYMKFQGAVPLSFHQDGTLDMSVLSDPEAYFMPRMERITRAGLSDSETSERMSEIQRQIDVIKELTTGEKALAPQEIDTLLKLERINRRMRVEAAKRGHYVGDVTQESLNAAPRIHPDDAIEWQMGSDQLVQGERFYITSNGTEHLSRAEHGINVTDPASQAEFGWGVGMTSHPKTSMDEVPEIVRSQGGEIEDLSADVTEVAVHMRPGHIKIIDRRAGQIASDEQEVMALRDEIRKTLERPDIKAEKIKANPELASPEAWERHANESVNQQMTEYYKQHDYDGIVVIAEDGSKHITAFDPSMVKTLDSSVDRIKPDRGYFARMPSDEAFRAMHGEGDPLIVGTPKLGRQVSRKYIHKLEDEAESLIKTDLANRADNPIRIEGAFFERDVLKSHTKYAHEMAQGVVNELLGYGARKITAIGDIAPRATGGVVGRQLYDWVIDGRRVSRLGEGALRAAEKGERAWQRATEYDMKVASKHAEELAEIQNATLFGEGSSHLAAARRKVARAGHLTGQAQELEIKDSVRRLLALKNERKLVAKTGQGRSLAEIDSELRLQTALVTDLRNVHKGARLRPGDGVAVPSDIVPGAWPKYRDAEVVSLASVKKYREFNRASTNAKKVQELADDILRNGVKEPVILDYNPALGKASLSEGNHRLAAIEKLVAEGHTQFENIPVRLHYSTRYLKDKGVSASYTDAAKQTDEFGAHEIRRGLGGEPKPTEVFTDLEPANIALMKAKTPRVEAALEREVATMNTFVERYRKRTGAAIGRESKREWEIHRRYNRASDAIDEALKIQAKYKTTAMELKPALVEKGRNLTGFEPLGIRGLEDYMMPSYIAKEFQHAANGLKDIGDMRKLWRRWVNGPWKTWATVYYPGFHARNNMGAWFNNWLGGVNETDYIFSHRISRALSAKANKYNDYTIGGNKIFVPDDYTNAAGLREALGKLDNEPVTWTELGNYMGANGIHASNSQEFADIMTASEKMRRDATIKKPYKEHRIRKRTAAVPKSYARGARWAAETTENFHRRAAMVRGLLHTPADGVAARGFVMMRHGDYTELTDFENYIKDLLPFYKWLRTNLPFQFHQLTQAPGKQLAVLKARDIGYTIEGKNPSDERRKLPDWMEDEFAIPLGKFGKGDDGLMHLVLDLPMSDLYTGAHEYASMFLPTVRPFLESKVLEKNLFTGQPLEGKRVPLAAWANLPGIRNVLGAFGMVEKNADGDFVIDDKVQNMMSAIPIFSRFRNWVMSDPDRMKLRMNAFASGIFGAGLRPVGEDELTSAEMEFYYNEIEPLITRLQESGVTLPDKDMIPSGVWEFLGYEDPNAPPSIQEQIQEDIASKIPTGV